MPAYKLRGTECGSTSTIWAPMSAPPTTAACPCGCKARRVYTAPSIPAPFQGHFNHSVGSWVSSERAFDDKLKQGSDEMSERVGTEHRYVRLDPQEATRLPERN